MPYAPTLRVRCPGVCHTPLRDGHGRATSSPRSYDFGRGHGRTGCLLAEGIATRLFRRRPSRQGFSPAFSTMYALGGASADRPAFHHRDRQAPRAAVDLLAATLIKAQGGLLASAEGLAPRNWSETVPQHADAGLGLGATVPLSSTSSNSARPPARLLWPSAGPSLDQRRGYGRRPSQTWLPAHETERPWSWRVAADAKRLYCCGASGPTVTPCVVGLYGRRCVGTICSSPQAWRCLRLCCRRADRPGNGPGWRRLR
jgi:hypothetical protein